MNTTGLSFQPRLDQPTSRVFDNSRLNVTFNMPSKKPFSKKNSPRPHEYDPGVPPDLIHLNQTISNLSASKREKGISVLEKMDHPTEVCIETLPRSLHINSNFEARTVTKQKEQFMRNNFDHKNFNKWIASKEGKSYYMGLNKKSEFQEEAELSHEKAMEDDFVMRLAEKHG